MTDGVTHEVSGETLDAADAAVAEEKERREGSGRKDVTLGERGPLLALGIPDPAGTLHKGIELREWKGKQMRELGKLREDNENLNLAEHVNLVLSTMCSRIGAHDFSKCETKEKRLAISQMYTGDAFHAYAWARLKSLGSELFIDVQCPVCRYKFPWEGDLSTLTITTAETLKDALWKYDLINPVQLRGRDVKRLVMGPSQWHHVEKAQIEGRLDMEGGQLAMVEGVVYGIEGHEDFRLTQGEIDELSGRDIARIVGLIDTHYIGPDMRIETECERKMCKAKIIQPINWNYQDFFGASFRSPTERGSTISSSR